MGTTYQVAAAMNLGNQERDLDLLCEHPLVQKLADFADEQVGEVLLLTKERDDLEADRQALQTEIEELNRRIAELEVEHE